MKNKIWIILACLLMGCMDICAQNNNVPRMTEQQLPTASRKAYVNQAKSYLRNYYEQLLLNVQDGMVQESFIRLNLVTKKTNYNPEFLLQLTDENQFLEPDQYLMELDKQYAGFDVDKLHFTIDNISINLNDFFVPSLVSCYLIAEYDLTLKEDARLLFKRRCRAYCIFPNISAYIDVKLLQVEPLRNIIAYQPPQKTEKDFSANIDKKETSVTGGDTWAAYGFDFMGKFNKYIGIAVVYKNKKYGFVHEDGTVIAEPIYDSILCGELKILSNEEWQGDIWYMSVCKDGKWGMMDRNGRMVIPTIYQKIQSAFRSGDDMIWVCNDNHYGCVDKSGNVSLPLIYEAEIHLRGGLPARAKKDGKWGVVNAQGETVVPFVYDYAGFFYRDYVVDDNQELKEYPSLAWVRKNNKIGFVNVKGQLVIPLEYEDTRTFSRGKVAVMKNGKWGYVDTNGKVVIPLIYDGANQFYGKTGTVRKGNFWAMIDEKGNNVTPFIYNNFHTFSSTGNYTATKAGKDVFLDMNGNEYATEQDRQLHSDSIMATQGWVWRQWDMGQKHLKTKNYSRALYWFKMAADNGHISSMVETGKIYYYGFGVREDYTTALKYFEKAGKKDKEACYFLGWMAEHGQGREKSLTEAIVWYANCPKYRDADERLKKLKGQQ